MQARAGRNNTFRVLLTPYTISSGGAVLLFGLYCLCLGGMFSNGDSRLILTVTETFSDLAGVRDIFNYTMNYTVADNPVGLAHVPFPSQIQTLDELEDAERRGLISASWLVLRKAGLQTNWTLERSLLKRVMMASWCSSGPGIRDTLPADRTPGCRCIADAYLEFVNTSRPGSGVAVVPADVRDRIAARVYRCWDLRLVRRSRACGDVCKLNLLGLPLFTNIVLFLSCIAFVLSFHAGQLSWSSFQVKALLWVAGGLLCIPYYVQYPESNTLNLTGVVVCLFYLTVSLDKGLSSVVEGGSVSDSALVQCILINLPLVLSAHAVQFGVSGYGRDIGAVVAFGVTGGLLGHVLQVCWACVFRQGLDLAVWFAACFAVTPSGLVFGRDSSGPACSGQVGSSLKT
jgi:hypothetical protein